LSSSTSNTSTHVDQTTQKQAVIDCYLVNNSIKHLKYLVADSQTPKGLNEQAVKELRRVGFYKSLEKSLNNILKRLK